jgi:hypothetical protein
MQLITSAQREKLLENGRAQRAATDLQDQAIDFEPVVKRVTPDAQCTWLLTELDPDDPDLAIGLDDLGMPMSTFDPGLRARDGSFAATQTIWESPH